MSKNISITKILNFYDNENWLKILVCIETYKFQQSCMAHHYSQQWLPSWRARGYSLVPSGRKEPSNSGGFKPLTSGAWNLVAQIRLQNRITWMR